MPATSWNLEPFNHNWREKAFASCFLSILQDPRVGVTPSNYPLKCLKKRNKQEKYSKENEQSSKTIFWDEGEPPTMSCAQRSMIHLHHQRLSSPSPNHRHKDDCLSPSSTPPWTHRFAAHPRCAWSQTESAGGHLKFHTLQRPAGHVSAKPYNKSLLNSWYPDLLKQQLQKTRHNLLPLSQVRKGQAEANVTNSCQHSQVLFSRWTKMRQAWAHSPIPVRSSTVYKRSLNTTSSESSVARPFSAKWLVNAWAGKSKTNKQARCSGSHANKRQHFTTPLCLLSFTVLLALQGNKKHCWHRVPKDGGSPKDNDHLETYHFIVKMNSHTATV